MDGKRDNVIIGRNRTPPVRMVVERTVMGSSHGNKTNVVPILELTKVDHHFVPTIGGSDEDLQIVYKIRGYDNEEVKLRITNPTHTPPVVYERPLTIDEKRMGANKIIKWNGKTNCTAGELKNKLINPMYGAYQVELVSRRKTTPALETHVIFRELKIERMNWAEVFFAVTRLPAAKFPTNGGKLQQWAWIQYKLNELGYYAGPVMGTKIDLHAAMRAIFRYTQEHPDFPTIYDFKTLDSGSPGGKSKWGWLAEWGKVFGPLGQLFQLPLKQNIAKLIDRLEKSERPYDEVLESKEVFESPFSESKLFVDHNIFYQNKDFSGEDAHADYDAEFCNRALLPLKAKALLLSRLDADASKEGVDSPHAVGEFECEWRAFDPPEDVSVVPLPTRAKVRLATKARAYLDTVHREVDGKYGDRFDTQDNCPPEYGGFRPKSATDVKDFFSSLAPAFPSRLEDGNRFFSKANWGETYPPGIYGTNCAVFQSSYIAGDNYVVQARLAFEKHKNFRALVTIHYGIERLKPSLKLKGIVKYGDPARFLIGQTGKLTIWRRTAVAQVVDWGPSNYPPIDWFKVIDVFRAAHMELIIPKQAPVRLDTLFDTTAKNEIVKAIVTDALAGTLNEPNKTEFTTRQGQKAFNPNGFHPIPFRTLDSYETTPAVFTDDGKGSSKKARFDRYSKYLASLISNYPSYDYMFGSALAIRTAFDRLRSTPGVIIVRTAYLPKPDWNVLLPRDVAGATVNEQTAFNPVRGVSTGMDRGIVFLDAGQYTRFTDEFFFSHEISHCLFGSHAFEPTSQKDHDAKDQNCIMYYGNKNSGENSGWGARIAPSREYTININLETFEGDPTWVAEKGEFQGKFVSGIKSRGKISGKFKQIDARNLSLTGSLDTVQKALNEFKFEPNLVLNDKDKAKPPNVFTAIKVIATDLEPKSSEGYLPLARKIAENSGATKPFVNLTLEPFSLKDNEPRFCGKCLLKIRGWRIRTFVDPQNGLPPPEPLPEKSIAYLTKPRMEFVKYRIQDGKYFAQVGTKQDFVSLIVGATDPQDPTIKLGPLRFLHEHKLTWESTDGKLASLKGAKTREWVRFPTPTQAAPFSVAADPDQEFYMGEADASLGEGTDDHSIRLPSLICAYPLAPGSLIGEQWYQYKMPGEDWQNFPEAAFLLEKTVYQNGPNWVLKFKKTNWEEYNPNPFLFEVHYLIGREPLSKPIPMNVSYQPTPIKPHYDSSGGIIMAAGTQEIGVSKDKTRDTTPEELERLGFLAPKPWL